jgi:antitoxin component YwqK of YwqJK toxin-antitoxin module
MSILSISTISAIAATSLSLSLFGGSVLDWRNAEVNNGAIYAGHANKPFSGKVTNVPFNTIFSPNSKNTVGFFQQATAFMTVTGQLLTGFQVFCDVESDDGILDGKVDCMSSGSGDIVVKAKFDSGVLDGALKYYIASGKTLVTSIPIKNGQSNGEQKIYSQKNGQIIHTITWKNGIFNGKEEGFDANTGNRILAVNYVNGKINGEYTQWAPDGKQIIFHSNYRNGNMYGQATGILQPGNIKYTVNSDGNGMLDGTSQFWDENGKLIFLREWVHGEKKPLSPEATQCLSKTGLTIRYPSNLQEMIQAVRINRISKDNESKEELIVTQCLSKPSQSNISSPTAATAKATASQSSSNAPDSKACPGAELSGTPSSESIVASVSAIENCGPAQSKTTPPAAATHQGQVTSDEYKEAYKCAKESFASGYTSGPAAFCVGNSRDPSKIEEQAYQDAEHDFKVGKNH